MKTTELKNISTDELVAELINRGKAKIVVERMKNTSNIFSAENDVCHSKLPKDSTIIVIYPDQPHD